jgi:hypothetical protein
MNALLNIGLLRNTSGFVRLADINRAFDQFNVLDLKHRVAIGTNQEEDTYIVHVQGWTNDKARAIATALEQDCIAQYDLHECEGSVVGPRAADWGAFNAALFKLL